jgi:hypothetical protein
MRRSPGRPPLDDDEESVPVCVVMTTTQYDETYARAQRERVTVPERIRRDVQAASKKYSK